MSIGNKKYLKEEQKRKYESLLNILKGYEGRGIRVTVEGILYPVQKCAEIMSYNEGDCFMPDINFDNLGRIVEVNYDRILRC
ncbi:MAG: hypothetical protein Q4D29_02865 [Lachnospiraceae bacterium]|nr:hypothetical protein [Lachnospiraceae bacterium]